jgi:hypothetical protein
MLPILSNIIFLMEVKMSESKLKNVGQLWTGKDKKTQPMLSGNIDLGIMGKFNVLVLKNGKKGMATHPDYLVFVKDGSGEPEIPMPADSEL